jgi:thiol oxidase
VSIQVESKYGHSSTGDPAFPKQQWPTAAECLKCRLPGSQDVAAQADVSWNEDEVYNFLAKHYGRHAEMPGSAVAKDLSSSRERTTGGGSAIMQAALEAEEEASPGGLFGSVFTMAAICSVLVVAVLVLWARSAFGLMRRPSGGKGTWSLGHRYGAANGMPRHGRSMMRGKVAF